MKVFPDLKWVWLPFTPSHEGRLQAELTRLACQDEKVWIFGQSKEIAAIAGLMDRIASRAEGLLSVLAIPFSLFAFSLALDSNKGPLTYLTSICLLVSLVFLFRCVIVTWATPDMLGNNEKALKHYIAVLMARIRSFYIGMFFGFLTLIFLAAQVAVKIYE